MKNRGTNDKGGAGKSARIRKCLLNSAAGQFRSRAHVLRGRLSELKQIQKALRYAF